MKRSHRMAFITIIGILALFLAGCGNSPTSSTGSVAATTPATTPAVELGYLTTGNYDSMPAAFVDYKPGMVISAAYSPPAADNSVRHSLYKQTITYASGKTTEVEFFVVRSGPEGTEYEAVINGEVTKVPDIKDYLANIETKMEDKTAFTFYPYSGSWQQALMKLPPLCEEPVQMNEQLSKIDGKDWLNSLDSITVLCPSTGITTSFTFSYEREQASEPYIRSFTVKSDQSGGK